jgi:hypothetical protein
MLAPQEKIVTRESHVVTDEDPSASDEFHCHRFVVGRTKAKRKGVVVYRTLQDHGAEQTHTIVHDGDFTTIYGNLVIAQAHFDQVQELTVCHRTMGESAWRRGQIDQITTIDYDSATMSAESGGNIRCS